MRAAVRRGPAPREDASLAGWPTADRRATRGCEDFVRNGLRSTRDRVSAAACLVGTAESLDLKMLRWLDGQPRTEEQLGDAKILSGMGFDQREIEFLRRHAWWELPNLYLAAYADSIANEYQPFGVGLDGLDAMSLSELLKKDHASPAAIRFFGGSGSALQAVWHNAILKRRGVPLFPKGIYRLKGGNHLLPETFARRLGERLRLACPITGIEHGGSGVTVRYRESGKERLLEADYLVCCMSAVMLRQIPVSP